MYANGSLFNTYLKDSILQDKYPRKGYKIFNPDWTCRGVKFEVGETYTMTNNPILCNIGYHYCKNLKDLFKYYLYYHRNKIAEVEVTGDISGYMPTFMYPGTYTDGNKFCTNGIKIVREVTWDEVYEKLETDSNKNAGSFNTGHHNFGNNNSGSDNTGNYNTGNYNWGDKNSGDHNYGDFNTGKSNAGDHNTGDYNRGCLNSGNMNYGTGNRGDNNSGSCNTGFGNIGESNIGDFNRGNFNYGSFNTKFKPGKLRMFNKSVKYAQYMDLWKYSQLRKILTIAAQPVRWIECRDCEIIENFENPQMAICCNGELKVCDITEYHSNTRTRIDRFSDYSKQKIKDAINLPNFDKDIFYECTGIDISKIKV